MSKLRVGIIGCGGIARSHCDAIAQLHDQVEVLAVADLFEEKRRGYMEKYNIPKGYDSHTELLEDDDIDAVAVTLGHQLHHRLTVDACNAGKHVLCEKAMANNVTDAREMYAAANKNNVMLQDGVWTRFFPAVEHARSLIEDGEIGEVMTVQADFDTFYTTQAATLAFGDQKPASVQVAGRHFGPGGAMLEFEGNRFAVLTFIAFPSEFPEVTEFIGTKGRITLEQPAHCPTRLTLRVPPRTPSRYSDANQPSPEQRFEYPLRDTINVPDAYPNQQGFIYQTEAIHRCLAAGLRECPQMDQQASLHNLEVLASIRALKEGRSHPVPSKSESAASNY